MAYGQSTYADIASLVDNIHQGAVTIAQNTRVIANLVTVFGDQMGMQPRDVNTYGTADVRQFTEGQDTTPTQLGLSALATVTPTIWRDQFLLTDQRVATSPENEVTRGAEILGNGFTHKMEYNLAGLFTSLTGGTVGTAGSALTWAKIQVAHALLEAALVPKPYYCILHTYQWLDLVQNATVNNDFSTAPAFSDDLMRRYFIATAFGGDVIFAKTPAVRIDGSDDATGAMFSRSALALDLRKPFEIAPERDESREAWELNARMWYGYGVWRADYGVQIVSDATTPS